MMSYVPVGFAGLCLDCDVVFSLLDRQWCPVCLRESWMPLSRITGRTGLDTQTETWRET